MNVNKNTKIKIDVSSSAVLKLHNGLNGTEFITPEKEKITIPIPARGLRAKKLEDGEWYWVCVCGKCLGVADNSSICSFDLCDKHNVCDTCGIHRSKIKDTPWGTHTGWQCCDCHDKEKAALLKERLETVKRDGSNTKYTNTPICPKCGTELYDYSNFDDDEEICGLCDEEFLIEAHVEISYSTRRKGK